MRSSADFETRPAAVDVDSRQLATVTRTMAAALIASLCDLEIDQEHEVELTVNGQPMTVFATEFAAGSRRGIYTMVLSKNRTTFYLVRFDDEVWSADQVEYTLRDPLTHHLELAETSVLGVAPSYEINPA